jgi:RHS repeat-associated protein
MSPVLTNESTSEPREQFALAAPQLSLPKGGGAIRGMGEKFAANPVTGTGTTTVPIFASPGRSGFGPKLSLSYDSGSGNSPFGFGWSLGLPSITRKTDKGLPQYKDAEESDTYILSGAEDLMPQLVLSGGQWTRDVTPLRTVYGKQYRIHCYRPRVEGLFARIERWTNLVDPQDTYWRSISKDNVTTWYGTTPESRIADPANPSRIFTWLICQSYDDKGNVASYEYQAEDSTGVDLTQANERNRSDVTRGVMRHIASIYYGNCTPYFPDLTGENSSPLPTDWCFQLVFDYGDRDLQNPNSQSTSLPSWTCRFDPYSTYRSTVEVRTYRLCRRILMFHHFASEPNVGTDCLVRSTDLLHAAEPSDPTKPGYSYLLSATQSSYVRNASGGYLSTSLPPVEFEYTDAELDETVREIDGESLQNEPYGLDGSKYRWVDLDGEGLSGILTEQGGSWFYKANLSPANQRTVNGEVLTLPQFVSMEDVASQPSLTALGQGHQQLMDLSGDGQLDIVQFEGPSAGFFERTEKGGWKPFQSFDALPVVEWQNPNMKFIDLTGDGFPDLLISDDDAFWWHTSFSIAGFGPAQRAHQFTDEEKGPQLLFEDGTESVFIADMSGDGLSDLVRVRNGEVCYWPNLGYGRFGAKVTMDNAPIFDRPDLYDGRRIRLADIDGSGTADIIYFASDRVQLFYNQSGNAWGDQKTLDHYPSVESVSSATALDLLGNGTACLLWSSPLAGNANRPMRYIDLMGGQKPHLLVHTRNNLGSETAIQYAPSTKFYVADKIAGSPWVTRLPFPVHVVEHVETYDYVGRNRFATQYSYHHGYYDGVEREFRGFGRIDQWDTEEYASLAGSSSFPQGINEQASSNVPPVLTKTWFHTGAYFGEGRISRHLEHEYYAEGDSSEALAGLNPQQLAAMLLSDTVLPTTILLGDGSHTPYNLSGEEMREACRALRGSMLRQEVYALDGSEDAGRPYSVTESNYTIEVLQPQEPNKFGVFVAHTREAVNLHYERKLFKVVGNTLADQNSPSPFAVTACDPRVTHAMTLAIDYFGNVLKSAEIGYGRRYLDPSLTAADQARQSALICSYGDNSYTNAVTDDDNHRNPLPSESSSYELLQLSPAGSVPGITNLFRFDEMQAYIRAASDGLHDIPYEQVIPTGLNAGQVYRRLLGSVRTRYRPNDMGAAVANSKALLPLGQLESLALPGSGYKLAFTPGLVEQVYQRAGNNLLPTPANVLGSVTADGGGYVDLDGDGHWWIQSGRVYYANPTIPVEKNQALAGGFLPRRFEDPFGNAAVIDYDTYGLLVAQTTDAVGNVVAASNDYRVLAPSLMADANGNRTAVTFDILGMVAGTAVMGKTTENLGDSLSGFAPDLSQQQIDDFYAAADPHSLAGAMLANATTRVVYDVNRFWNSRTAAPNDPTQWEPPFAATIAREIHISDLASGQQSKMQISFGYSDGFGREIQRKVQAEPDPTTESANPRWAGTGWTIFNNKVKAVRQYEPFFSQLALGQQFEFGVQVGVSPILCYDPVTRVVATIHPDHTYEKVVFDPWHQQTFDGNDNVLETDPTLDPDVGDYFQRLPNSDYTPSWYALRTDPAYAAQAALQWPDPTVRSAETAAATKTSAHANTPSTGYLDSLGRAFLTIADNAAAGKYSTHVALDIQGLQRVVTDALNREVMTYDYDMLGNRIHQSSMEAGQRWMLADVAGKPIRAWDARGHNLRTAYDAARRPAAFYVQGTDATNSDPRTIPAEVLFQKTTYGEGEANDQALNLRTRVFQTFDSAAVVTNFGHNSITNQDEGYDFKGNLLRSTRQFVADYKALPNWTASPALSADLFTSSTQYDALNRPVSSVSPDGSVFTPTYNEAGFPETLSVILQGAATATPFVTNIDYDPKGRRTLIEYENQTTTTYSYDPQTFRLNQLTTTRSAFPANQQTVQDLTYVYDPVGNITHIQDDADTQNVVFFRNQRVEPSNDFIYDAIYRLTQASGREQLGLDPNGNALAPSPSSYNDVPRVWLSPSRTDGRAMGTYTEKYEYDAVGNFLQFVHSGSQPSNPGWTRTYTYNEQSLLEPGKVSNRLTRTTISGNMPLNESYKYDVHGNMALMPQLQAMEWNFKDELLMTRRQYVTPSDSDGVQHQGQRTYYVYDGSGERARKVTESSAGIKIKERFYSGGFEVYREYDSSSTVTLERQTLHVTDSKQRIALVETRTQGNDGSPAQLQRYQFNNHLGSASLELDDQAQVITYEEYCPYGNTSYQAGRNTVEVSLKRYRYAGMERDKETGLSYQGARYCALWLGRWIGCDPGGLVDGLNLFAYAHNRPTTLVDTSGLAPVDPIAEASAKVAATQSELAATQSALTRADTAVAETKYRLENAKIHEGTLEASDKAMPGRAKLIKDQRKLISKIDKDLSSRLREQNQLEQKLESLTERLESETTDLESVREVEGLTPSENPTEPPDQKAIEQEARNEVEDITNPEEGLAAKIGALEGKPPIGGGGGTGALGVSGVARTTSRLAGEAAPLAIATLFAALQSKNKTEFVENTALNVAIARVPPLAAITAKDEGHALFNIAAAYGAKRLLAHPLGWVAAGTAAVGYLLFMKKDPMPFDQQRADIAIAKNQAGQNINPFCYMCHGEGGALDPNNERNPKARCGDLNNWQPSTLISRQTFQLSPFPSVH